MLFHLGALWRLNDAALLPRLDRVSSVSAGSVVAATLGMSWNRLAFDNGVARDFEDAIVEPIRTLARRTLDWRAVLEGMLLPGGAHDRLSRYLREIVYGRATLQDLPEAPRIVVSAHNVDSGALWRFSKPYMADYRLGMIRQPTVALAQAVGASIGLTFNATAELRLSEDAYVEHDGAFADLDRTRVHLTDAGYIDPLALEAAWGSASTVLVSDGGGVDARPRERLRITAAMVAQIRALRKRQAIEAYSTGAKSGTYWGVRSDLDAYQLTDALAFDPHAATALANMPARLRAIDDSTQEQLINWGYALADAAVRRHVDRTLPPPAGFPYPLVPR
jgi:NTE family protein